MPSPGEDIQAWSVVASNNGTSDPLINWAEGQARASVNNSARGQMAAHAKNRNLLNGSIVTTGSPNAQQFLSGLTYTTIPTNLIVRLKIGGGLTNTAPVTLNMDGLGDTSIKTADGVDCKGGELVGDGYVDLLYNGTNWVFLYGREFFWNAMTGGDGIIIGKQVFTASGTYTPTAGMECCIIECVGGGGGGNGKTGSGGVLMTAAGGGSGGYSRKLATAADIGASQVVTIGAGGAGGSYVGDAPGAGGGDTSVGTLCIAKGATSSSSWHLGGNGGPPGTGDVVAAGSPGLGGIYTHATEANVTLGGGGSSYFGGGAPSTAWAGDVSSTSPAAASNYGGGGAGPSLNNTGAGVFGSNGSAGVVVIMEFAGRGAPGRDGEDGATGPIGPVGPSGAGTGDVLRSGIPTVGQIAVWTDASHIQGINPGAVFSVMPQGRLTLQTATPVMTTTQSAKTTLFYSPYCGNQVPIYNGTSWAATSFNELSVLTTDTTNSPAQIGVLKVNDWFVWLKNGVLTLSHGPDWTSDVTRSAGTAITRRNGIFTNDLDIVNGPAGFANATATRSNGTYVGTTRSNASSQLDFIFASQAAGGGLGFIGVWNAYNRTNINMFVQDTLASFAYSGPTGYFLNSPAWRVSFVSGLQEDSWDAQIDAWVTQSATGYGTAGIGYDTQTANSGFAITPQQPSQTVVTYGKFGTMSLGFHFVQATMTSSGGAVTFYGNVSSMLSFRWRC